MFSWLFDTAKPGWSFIKIYSWFALCWVIIIVGLVQL